MNRLYNETAVQDIANAIRSVNGSTDTYTISEMPEAISNISTGLDWSELNYDTSSEDKGLPLEIKNAFIYAKYIYDNWAELRERSVPKYTNNKKMFLFPNVDITENGLYNAMFEGSNLLHIEPCIIGEATPTGTLNCSTMFKDTWIESVKVSTKTSTQDVNSTSMFYNCVNLASCELNFNATNVTSMFNGCKSLTSITGTFDTTGANSFESMFSDCQVIETIPTLDTSSCTSFRRCLANCYELKTAPTWDLSHATNLGQMFWSDTKLENIPEYTLTAATTLQNMYQSTGNNLTNNSLNNILASCISATTYTGTKTLHYLGLSSTYDSVVPTLSNYNDFLAAGWSIS